MKNIIKIKILIKNAKSYGKNNFSVFCFNKIRQYD